MARKKKRTFTKTFFKIFFWLCFILMGSYYGVHYFINQPQVFYPGFQIKIPSGYEIHGIDVSRYQSTINWKEIKNMEVKGIKIGFVFMKATEGVSNVDEQFRRNWLKAEEENIYKGAYHFFIPGKNAKRQAQNFIEIVNLKKGICHLCLI